MTETTLSPSPADAARGEPALHVALIIASVRAERLADALLPWLTRELAARDWLDADVIDLREQAVDPSSLRPGGQGPLARRLDVADAFVVLTPEYNHSYPGALKEALDAHYAEWARKPATFVSYGAASGGLRAVEHLRPVFTELRATTTRNAVGLVAPWEQLDSATSAFVPTETQEAALEATLAELHWWAAALRTARAGGTP